MMNKYDDGGGGEDNDEKDAVNHLVCRCELFWTGGCGELGNDTAGLYLVTMMIMTINKNLMITMMMMMMMMNNHGGIDDEDRDNHLHCITLKNTLKANIT